MLVSMKYILDNANKNNYAVMAINCINMEMLKGAISAADEESSPIIINIGQGQMKKHASIDLMVSMVKILAEKSSIPIALNLDHGNSLDVEIDCMRKGFTSVMYDGSSLDLEKNIKNTRLIAELAHAEGICVEGELGHVGQANDNDDGKLDLYTDPKLALRFINETGVDCLAVAIGTAHGLYPKGYVPKLDFDRLREIKETVNIPLVLHGGSGSGEENIKKAVRYGINKINVCSDAFAEIKEELIESIDKNKNIDYLDLSINSEARIKDFVKSYIHLIGSNGRYKF